jgi:glycosyltransferase involved in cell wall biosynthesis
MHLVVDARSIHRHMGGIGRAALQLIPELARLRGAHRMTAILGADPPEGVDLGEVDLMQVEAGMIDEHFEQLGLPTVLEDLAADVYLNPCFSVPALRTSRAQASIIHDVVFEDHPDWVEPRLRDYLQRWSRFSAASADHLITVSEHARARIGAVYGVAGERITAIPNGIPATAFARPPDERLQRVRVAHRLGAEPFVLYLGSLEPKKGTPTLIRAFASLVARGFTGTLVLAGSPGGVEMDLPALIAGSGCPERIRVAGYVDESDKQALLAAADQLVYPSRYEGFGIPPLEAMALGTPCVTSNVTSLPEVVGDVALTVPPDDHLALSAAMLQARDDEAFRARARAEGPQRARRFAWPQAARRYWDVCAALGGA